MEQNISVAYRLFGASMLSPISTLDCKSPRKARSAKDWHCFADTKLSFCAIFPPGYVANVRFGAPPRRCPAPANGRPPPAAPPPASAPCPPELPLAGTAPLRAAPISECGSPPQSPSASVPRDPRRPPAITASARRLSASGRPALAARRRLASCGLPRGVPGALFPPRFGELPACARNVTVAPSGKNFLKPPHAMPIMHLCVCVPMDTPGRVVRRRRDGEPPSAPIGNRLTT